MSEAEVALPRWQSHKRVWADKVTGVLDDPLRWKLACGGVIEVSQVLRMRLPPDVASPIGGYYVRYEDSFESWSPAQAFENGYTQMTGA